MELNQLPQLDIWGKRPKFLARQIFAWLYKKKNFQIEEWSDVSKKNREWLQEHFTLDLPKIVWNQGSIDGTQKFLVAFGDQKTVEMVLIPAKNRMTLCVSSQVGCALACTFCHTGTQGLKRHLKTFEIVGQFVLAQKWLDENQAGTKITNMVYMGQGEPLHNFENIGSATRIFLDPLGIGFGQRRITLSTVGMIDQIKRIQEIPPVNIAISLHSARDEVRSELMPINRQYGIDELFKTLKNLPLKPYRRITYEYLLIEGLNDTEEDIQAICKNIEISRSKINLLPFNEFPGAPYKRPSDEKVQWFQNRLIRKGYTCTVRITKGEDILAACGQLKSHVEQQNLWTELEAQRVLENKDRSQFSFSH